MRRVISDISHSIIQNKHFAGPPTLSDYRPESLKARPGLTTRDGCWYQYQRTPTPGRKPTYYSVFDHGWSDKCELSQSCFQNWDNNCIDTSDDLAVKTAKAGGQKDMPRHHLLKVFPEWEDIWEGEQAQQTLLGLEHLVKGCGRGLQEHCLFWPHPKYKYDEKLQRRSDKLCCGLLYILICILALALYASGVLY